MMHSNDPLWVKHMLLNVLPLTGRFGLPGNVNQTFWLHSGRGLVDMQRLVFL